MSHKAYIFRLQNYTSMRQGTLDLDCENISFKFIVILQFLYILSSLLQEMGRS